MQDFVKEGEGLSQLTIRKSPTHLPLRNGQIYIKDAHYTETNKKFIFKLLRFLFFQLSSIVSAIYNVSP